MKKLALTLSILFCAPAAFGALYTQDFEVDPTATWTINDPGISDTASDFFFDYSTVGIPPAPNGSGGSRGMKLQANLTGGVFSGYSVSPTGQDFGSSYRVTFDWWANFNGPFPGGGSGSTNLSTFGVGTAGTSAQWPGGVQDSVWFGATGDGGSSVDWRAYSTAAGTGYPDGSPVFSAAGTGNRNNTHPYYAGFGNVPAPAAQLALYAQQTGNTAVGSAGMAWHEVEIVKEAGLITWFVNGLQIAQVDESTVSLAGGNIFFGHSDINATSSADPNAPALLFTLIDNVVVIPEPATLALLALGGLALLRKR